MKQKRNFILTTVLLACIFVLFSCKKSGKDSSKPVTASFTEEFINVPGLNAQGWLLVNKTSPHPDYGDWKQGTTFTGKGGSAGLSAYSYTTSPAEYIGASGFNNIGTYDLSGWLITPLLKVKNGDKISFYTCGLDQTGNTYKDRLQVLLNPSGSTDVGKTSTSTGGFNTTLFDINPGNMSGGYPLLWTQYTYTFSGISGTKNIRIGFRYFVPKTEAANMIGIDQFKFESQ